MSMRLPSVGSIHITCGSSPPGGPPLNPVKLLPPSVDLYAVTWNVYTMSAFFGSTYTPEL